MTIPREYRFKITAYTPATIPMARLAEYMAELAVVLGEEEHVHFVRLQKGSTVLVHNIENEIFCKLTGASLPHLGVVKRFHRCLDCYAVWVTGSVFETATEASICGIYDQTLTWEPR
jgi:hypothetical protein